MTAAAMLLPPYNDFFKVGWSESGNHDNNIYNQNWSEWNHGVKVIAKADSAAGAVRAGGTGAARRGGPGANAAAREVVQDSTNADKIKFDIRVPTNDELAGNQIEIDVVQRRVLQLEIEEVALQKETDAASKERLDTIVDELATLARNGASACPPRSRVRAGPRPCWPSPSSACPIRAQPGGSPASRRSARRRRPCRQHPR